MLLLTLLILCEKVENSEFENATHDENATEIIGNFIAEYPVDLWSERGFFTRDYLWKINRHWLIFPPQPSERHYVLAVLYGFIMLFGLFGNVLVIFLFLRCKGLRTPANTLVMNLAVSDALMMSKMPIFIYNSVHLGPALGEIACRYYGFVGGLSGTCSICTLTAISLDRFYVIKYPLNRRFTQLRAKIYLAISWLYAVAFSCVPLLDIGLGSYTPEGFLTSCSYDYLTDDEDAKIFILAFFVAAWVLPFAIITFAYVNIVRVVLVSKNVAKQQSRESSRHIKVEEKRRQELRLALIVFLVILLWFAAWTPYATVSLLGIFKRKDLISPLTSMIPALCCKLASCFDPFVYALTHPRFKSEIKILFGLESKIRAGSKMWTTQTSMRNTTRRVYDEEETSAVVPFDAIEAKFPSLKGDKERRVADEEFQMKSLKFKQRWWFKPSFSNRTSIRGLARSFTARERSKNYEGDTTVSHSF